jgi:hypothetical protein
MAIPQLPVHGEAGRRLDIVIPIPKGEGLALNPPIIIGKWYQTRSRPNGGSRAAVQPGNSDAAE